MSNRIFQGAKRLEMVQFSSIRTMLDKVAAMRAQGISVTALSAGEPNFNTPERIKQETIRAIEENYTHYGSNRGLPLLREIMVRQIHERYHISYDPGTEIAFMTGGAEALNNAILATVDNGDEVIVLTPAFVSYKNIVHMSGARCVELPLRPENDFQICIEDIERAITPRTRMVIMNNPNNPTGAVYKKETLARLADLIKEHDLLLLSDEMYADLVYEGEFVSMITFPGMKEHTILINGFSKTYAMTGWRLGYVLADQRIMTNIMKVHQYSSTCSPTFIQVGMAAAMEDARTNREVTQMIDEFRGRRELLLTLLDQAEYIRYVRPQGAFYCLLDVSQTGLTGEQFADRLLDEYHVAVVPAIGLGTGDACRDFVRISFAASREDIKRGLAAIEELAGQCASSKSVL